MVYRRFSDDAAALIPTPMVPLPFHRDRSGRAGRLTALAMAIASLALTACHKDAEATQASNPAAQAAAASPAIDSAFKAAPADLKEKATVISVALRQNEAPKAFLQLQDLKDGSQLTPEQNAAAAQAMSAVLQQLQASAAAGNPEASALLKAYRKSK